MNETFQELRTPEAKKIARAISEEPWASKLLSVSDPVLRRLGSMLVLQEIRERMGMSAPLSERRPYVRKVTAAMPAPPPASEDDAPDTLRCPPPIFDDAPACSGYELTCKGCKITKPEEDFYRKGMSRTGRQALCRPCFNARYHGTKR